MMDDSWNHCSAPDKNDPSLHRIVRICRRTGSADGYYIVLMAMVLIVRAVADGYGADC